MLAMKKGIVKIYQPNSNSIPPIIAIQFHINKPNNFLFQNSSVDEIDGVVTRDVEASAGNGVPVLTRVVSSILINSVGIIYIRRKGIRQCVNNTLFRQYHKVYNDE